MINKAVHPLLFLLLMLGSQTVPRKALRGDASSEGFMSYSFHPVRIVFQKTRFDMHQCLYFSVFHLLNVKEQFRFVYFHDI